MGEVILDITFASRLENMQDVLQRAIMALEDEGLIRDGQWFYARLCLEEAIVNAVVHGNCNEEGRTVRLRMERDGSCCRIAVCDEGAGFRLDGLPPHRVDDFGGRGLMLIRALMEDVTYDHTERCLRMLLVSERFGNGDTGND